MRFFALARAATTDDPSCRANQFPARKAPGFNSGSAITPFPLETLKWNSRLSGAAIMTEPATIPMTTHKAEKTHE